MIRLKADGEYYVVNEGRRPIFIDGKPVLTDVKAKLHHNSTFEVSDVHDSVDHTQFCDGKKFARCFHQRILTVLL